MIEVTHQTRMRIAWDARSLTHSHNDMSDAESERLSVMLAVAQRCVEIARESESGEDAALTIQREFGL